MSVHKKRTSGVPESPWMKTLDGPSRQLLWELGRLMICERQEFNEKLNRQYDEKEAAHNLELAAAAARHERIRREAEIEREKIEVQIQLEHSLKEQAEREKEEQKRKEQLERELAAKKELELAQVKEAARIAEDQAAKAQKEAAEQEKLRLEVERKQAEASKRAADNQAAEKQAAEKQAAEKQEAERKAKEAEILEINAKIAVVKAPTAPSTSKVPPSATNPETQSLPASQPHLIDPNLEAEHRRFLHIHQNLKHLRKYMVDQTKQDKNLKQQMGDMRRAIRKCVGQLTDGKGANKAPREELIGIFQTAAQDTRHHADITIFLNHPPASVGNKNGPALLVYLFNIFAKSLVSQFKIEAGVAPKSADHMGVMASQIFSLDDFRWNGASLIDILIAKFHAVCPVLFGICGDEKTDAGKILLGWERQGKNAPFVSARLHLINMIGLGAGFASIALRNYSKSKLRNPCPVTAYWKAVYAITSLPKAHVMTTHMHVMKGLIEHNESKIIEVFGPSNGTFLLRKALVSFPQEVGLQITAARSLAVLAEVVRTERMIDI